MAGAPVSCRLHSGASSTARQNRCCAAKCKKEGPQAPESRVTSGGTLQQGQELPTRVTWAKADLGCAECVSWCAVLLDSCARWLCSLWLIAAQQAGVSMQSCSLSPPGLLRSCRAKPLLPWLASPAASTAAWLAHDQLHLLLPWLAHHQLHFLLVHAATRTGHACLLNRCNRMRDSPHSRHLRVGRQQTPTAAQHTGCWCDTHPRAA